MENTVSWCSLEALEGAVFRLVRNILGLFTSTEADWLSWRSSRFDIVMDEGRSEREMRK